MSEPAPVQYYKWIHVKFLMFYENQNSWKSIYGKMTCVENFKGSVAFLNSLCKKQLLYNKRLYIPFYIVSINIVWVH